MKSSGFLGIPRLINRICEKSLMYGCQQNLRIIDDQDVIYVSEHEMLREVSNHDSDLSTSSGIFLW